MPHSTIADVIARAGTVVGPPYDPAGYQELCDVLEQILATHLGTEPTWPRHEWLDGFIAIEIERHSDRVTIRGGIWVSAVRPEPCEVEVQLAEPQGATIRFMDATGLSGASQLSRLKFPAHGNWRYSFQIAIRNSAG
jgi:hypothetical protein